MAKELESWNMSARISLREYVIALLRALEEGFPAEFSRLKDIVGSRRARITLDNESVEVYVAPEGLRVVKAPGDGRVDGSGRTARATVLNLLKSHTEVIDCILNDTLRVFGAPDAVIRMFLAIEILLDASPRSPALQSIAERFLVEQQLSHAPSTPSPRPGPWYPFASNATEQVLLHRLDLLP